MGEEVKQLLRYKGSFFIDLAIDSALKAGFTSPIVVLGANSERILHQSVSINKCAIAINPHWQLGMSSSIKAGLDHTPTACTGAMFQLCDQPLITASLLHDLASQFVNTLPDLLYPTYQNKRGNPVIIHSRIFPELLQNKGDSGGRFLFSNPALHTEPYQTEDNSCLVDIDTLKEYQKIAS